MPAIEERSASPAPARPSARLLWRCAVLFVAFNVIKHGLILPLVTPGVDFGKHWLAARAVLEGRSVYVGEELYLGFNYPQWSALVTFWLGWLSRGAAEIVWKLMMLASLVGAWWIATRLMRPGAAGGEAAREVSASRAAAARAVTRHWPLSVAVALTAFSPAGASALKEGNIQPSNVLLVVATAAAAAAGRERPAGVLWAMLCLIKMIPAALLLPVLLWRKRRMLEGFLAFMALYALALTATRRWGEEWWMLTEMLDDVPFRWRSISHSASRFILLFAAPEGWHEDARMYLAVTRATTIALGGVFVAMTIDLHRRGRSFESGLEFGLLFLPLLSPLLESHHAAWALPAMFWQMGRWARGEMSGGLAAAYAAGWGALSAEYFLTNFDRYFGDWVFFTPLGAIAWLVGCNYVELLGQRPDRSTPSCRRGNPVGMSQFQPRV